MYANNLGLAGMGDDGTSTTDVLNNLITQGAAAVKSIFAPVQTNPNVYFPTNPQIGPVNPNAGYYDTQGYYHPPQQASLLSSSSLPLLLGAGVLIFLLTRKRGK